MLNPKICEHCREINLYYPRDLVYKYDFWECPHGEADKEGNYIVSKNSVPPAGCGYALEHAVSESVNIDKDGGTDNAK